MVENEEKSSQKTYLFEVHLVPQEEVVPLRVFAVEDNVFAIEIVLQVVQFPDDIAKDYLVAAGF